MIDQLLTIFLFQKSYKHGTEISRKRALRPKIYLFPHQCSLAPHDHKHPFLLLISRYPNFMVIVFGTNFLRKRAYQPSISENSGSTQKSSIQSQQFLKMTINSLVPSLSNQTFSHISGGREMVSLDRLSAILRSLPISESILS